jgi:methyl-accepting chemotaxis protein
MMSAQASDRTPVGGMNPFSQLLTITESAFVEAGSNLEISMSRFQSLRSAFAALESALGADADAALKSMVAELSEFSEDLRKGFEQVGTTSGALRVVMSRVRSEVRSLNTVVQMFANIWINARIQGNSLMRPRPQIISFIETLGGLSAEADTILREVNEAMIAVMACVTRIEAAQFALSKELSNATFPAIDRFTDVARAISEEQAGLHEASQMIADRMRLTSSDIATLITSLQIGDTLRQRLEQVHGALAIAGPSPVEQSLSLRLAAVLGEGALSDSTPPVDTALDAVEAIAKAAEDIRHTAACSAFGTGTLRRAAVATGSMESFEQSIAAAREHFSAMQSAAQLACRQIDIILGHDPALQRVAQHLRMAGINAVIACARLGEEGRALRELAQLLRGGTDESDGIMKRLQEALGQSHAEVYSVSEDIVTRCEADLSRFLGSASRLGAAIGQTNDSLSQTSRQLDDAARDIQHRLATAGAALRSVRDRMQDSRATPAILSFLAAGFGDPDMAAPGIQDYLTAIRRKYTMASERNLHDDLIARLSGPLDAEVANRADEAEMKPEPPLMEEVRAVAPLAEDDLADILF